MGMSSLMDLQYDAELVDRVKQLTPAFAERAEEIDRNSRFPSENFAELRDAGLNAACIPKEWGGAGANSLTYNLILLELGKVRPSTALSWNMHSTSTSLFFALANEGQKKRILPRVAGGGEYFSSVTAERGMSFRHLVTLKSTFTPVDGGFRLSGEKISATLGEYAGLFFTTGFLAGEKTAAEAIMTAVIDKNSDGVEIKRVWDAMGMRGTASDNIVYEDAFVPRENILGGENFIGATGKIDITMFHLGFSAA